jgi:Mrp family chromosome partitioning ATPase
VVLTPYLSVLLAGRPDSDPMSGLTSDRMHRLISEAADAFDWVIIDTPPVVLLPDANLLATMVDGAILVIGAGKTPYKLITRAIDAIGRKKLLGVVLNRVDPACLAGGYGYGYYSYGER